MAFTLWDFTFSRNGTTTATAWVADGSHATRRGLRRKCASIAVTLHLFCPCRLALALCSFEPTDSPTRVSREPCSCPLDAVAALFVACIGRLRRLFPLRPAAARPRHRRAPLRARRSAALSHPPRPPPP
eukprot:5096048-Pleurochrysis_carterae.AAC.4